MDNSTYIKGLEYVDTRGIWPVYHNGLIAVTLTGKKHNISLADARAVVAKLLSK